MTQAHETDEVPISPETPEVLLTRSQAARRMGVSVSTLRRMEGVAVDPVLLQGRHYFRVGDIDQMRPRNDGEIAARAFAAFNAGKSVIDAVIEVQQPPEVIEPLHKKWVELSRSIVVQGFDDWQDFRKLFAAFGVPMLSPYLVQQCLAIVATSEASLDRLRRALRGEAVRPGSVA